jgi:MFS family permease
MMGAGIAALALPRQQSTERRQSSHRFHRSDTADAVSLGASGTRSAKRRRCDLDQAITAHTPTVVPRRKAILVASLMATFISAVAGTIVSTAMPTIIGELGGFRFFCRVSAAYLLTMAIGVPIYADLFGRKRVFFACTGIFLGGSTLCGFAPTMPTLVLFRVVQGLGVGAIQTLSNIILSDIHSPAERARVQGFVSMVFGAPAIGGPAIGAFIVENLHWSLVFWINLPIGAVSVLMYALFLDERLRRRDRQIDWIGCTLLAIGIGAGMLALAQARVLGIESIPLAILSVTAIVLLVRHER